MSLVNARQVQTLEGPQGRESRAGAGANSLLYANAPLPFATPRHVFDRFQRLPRRSATVEWTSVCVLRSAKRSIGTQRHPVSRGQPPC